MKNIGFHIGLLFFALVFLGVLAFSSTGRAQGNDEPKIYHLPPKVIAQHIERTAGKRRILVIYASWCPACRKIMPYIMDMETVRSGSVIAVAVDVQHINFAKYIKSMRNIPIRVILNKGSEDKLKEALAEFGVQPWKSIPTIILLDEENKVVQQGNLSDQEMADFLFAADSQSAAP